MALASPESRVGFMLSWVVSPVWNATSCHLTASCDDDWDTPNDSSSIGSRRSRIGSVRQTAGCGGIGSISIVLGRLTRPAGELNDRW